MTCMKLNFIGKCFIFREITVFLVFSTSLIVYIFPSELFLVFLSRLLVLAQHQVLENLQITTLLLPQLLRLLSLSVIQTSN